MTRISTISLMIVYSCFREGAWVTFRMLTTWNQIPSHHVNQYSKWPPIQCYRCDMFLVYSIGLTMVHTHINKPINICNHRLISDFALAVHKLTSLVVTIIIFSVINVWIVINKLWTGFISILIKVFINIHQVVIIYQNFRYTVQITFIFIDFRVCDFAFAFKTQNAPCVSRFERVLFLDRFQFAF